MKRILAFFLAALLVIRPGLVSYADENQDNSVVSTPSNALFVQPRIIGSAPNTVNRGYVRAQIDYVDSSGAYVGSRQTTVRATDGYFSVTAPQNTRINSLYFIFTSRALPYDGIFDLRTALTFNVVPSNSTTYSWNPRVFNLRDLVSLDNASNANTTTIFSFPDMDVISNPGQAPIYQFSGVLGSIQVNSADDLSSYLSAIAISRKTNIDFVTQYYFDISNMIPGGSNGSTISGYCYFQFSKSSATTPKYTMTGYNPDLTSSDETVSQLPGAIQGVQDSVDGVKGAVDAMASDIGSKLSDVISGIVNIPNKVADAFQDHFDNVLTQLHYITDQLQALWEQLSAFFNQQLIPQMITDTNRIVEAIENVDHQVEVDLGSLKTQLAQQHQEQLENDNKNTDKIVNGYENSDMDKVSGDMATQIEAYDTVEGELFDKVHNYLTGFSFDPNLMSGYATSLTMVSTILTGFFDISLVKVPLQLTLALTIALLLIGWYRFKSGG